MCCCSQGIANKATAVQTRPVWQAEHVCVLCLLIWSGIYPDLKWATVKVFQYLKVIYSYVFFDLQLQKKKVFWVSYSNFLSEVRFPNDYPTGCLLGCVNVTDCLSQEQFRQQVSDTRYTIQTLNNGKEKCRAAPFRCFCQHTQMTVEGFHLLGHSWWTKHVACQIHSNLKYKSVPIF